MDSGLVVAGQSNGARGLVAADFLELGCGLIEVHVDRIDLLDRRQQRGFALTDQRPLGDFLLARPSGDRGRHRGITQIDSSGFNIGFRLLHRSRGRPLARFSVVQIGPGHQAARDQLTIALRGDVRVCGLSLRRS